MPVLPVAALALAQLFDYVSFLVMVGRHGLAAEVNPIVVRVAEEFDVGVLALLKLAVVVYVALTAAVLAGRRPWLARGVISVGILAGLVGGFSNVASI